MKDNEDNMAVDANHETDITDNYYASSKKMVESNFTKLLKDRCYELDKTNDNNNDNDKNNDDNDSHKNNKKISSFKLLKLIANYESKISLYGQIEGFHNQLEMTFSELQKANKDYDLHHKQLEEIPLQEKIYQLIKIRNGNVWFPFKKIIYRCAYFFC